MLRQLVKLAVGVPADDFNILFGQIVRNIVAVIGVSLFYVMSDTVDDIGGLSAACACQNKQRPFGLKDGSALLCV